MGKRDEHRFIRAWGDVNAASEHFGKEGLELPDIS
jgi:hypothetical protein